MGRRTPTMISSAPAPKPHRMLMRPEKNMMAQSASKNERRAPLFTRLRTPPRAGSSLPADIFRTCAQRASDRSAPSGAFDDRPRATTSATVPRALCGRRRGDRGAAPGRGAARSAEAERRIDARATRLIEGIRGRGRRARRDRGLPARLFAVHQGGAGADGAGGGAAARAGRRHRRPPDRGQARHRRLGHRRAEVGRVPGVGLGLDARHHRPDHPARRDAGDHPRRPAQAARPAGGAHRDAAGDAAAGLAFRARADHRGGAAARGRRIRRRATPSTCWGRARARPPMPAAISTPMRPPSMPSARARARARCPTGPASRSSCRRCIRASRRSRASACSRSWCRTCSRSRARRATTTSTSPSMPRRPTGWSSPST